MKGCLLGRSLFYYLVSIDDYYVAVWGACGSKDEIPDLVQDMLYGGVVCFAFKSEYKQSVIDFMVSEDKPLISKYGLQNVSPKYRGYPGIKRFFDLQEPQNREVTCR
jgi:hypothetical protein